jgi:hypothetical protein
MAWSNVWLLHWPIEYDSNAVDYLVPNLESVTALLLQRAVFRVGK